MASERRARTTMIMANAFATYAIRFAIRDLLQDASATAVLLLRSVLRH